VRQVAFASEEPQQGPALTGDMIPDSSAQRGVRGFESIQSRTESDLPFDGESYLGAGAGEIS